MYNNALVTVKHQIQQAENPMPAMVIRVESPRVVNAIQFNNMACDVVLEGHAIGRTDHNMQIDINCTDDKLHFAMPESWGIMMMKVTKATRTKSSSAPAG
jgi:dihydroorotate dehydrogenase